MERSFKNGIDFIGFVQHVFRVTLDFEEGVVQAFESVLDALSQAFQQRNSTKKFRQLIGRVEKARKRECMKISRWKMICGLKGELFSVFSFYLYIVVGILFLYTQHFSINSIIFVCIVEAMMIFLEIINGYGYVTDIILKNIGETGWISGENMKYVCVISGFCHRSWGCEIKVFEEGKRPIKLKVYEKLAPWPEGAVSQYKIYYLRNCKAVVGWEVVREKINLSRKPRKSK